MREKFVASYEGKYTDQTKKLRVAATEFNRVHGNFYAGILADYGYTSRMEDNDGGHSMYFSGAHERHDDEIIDAACTMDEAVTQFWHEFDFSEDMPQKLFDAARVLYGKTNPHGLYVHPDDLDNVGFDVTPYKIVGRTDVFRTVGRLNKGDFLQAAAQLAVQADIVATNRVALGIPSILDKGPKQK